MQLRVFSLTLSHVNPSGHTCLVPHVLVLPLLHYVHIFALLLLILAAVFLHGGQNSVLVGVCWLCLETHCVANAAHWTQYVLSASSSHDLWRKLWGQICEWSWICKLSRAISLYFSSPTFALGISSFIHVCVLQASLTTYHFKLLYHLWEWG